MASLVGGASWDVENWADIGVSGMQANVVKVRPPLPFSRANADLFLERLDACLGE